MGVTTERFIRKPLYVDAVRVKADNFDEIVRWCQGEVQTDEVPGTGTTKKYIKVRVHNPKNPRQTKAFIGDWILYTDRGYKVYTNKAFRAAFDQVEGVEPKVQEMPPTRLGEGKQFGDAPVDLDSPLSEDEEAAIAAEEGPQEVATAEEIREKLPHAQDRRPTAPPQDEEKTHLETKPYEETVRAQEEREELQEVRPGADLGTTPQGEEMDDENVRQEMTGQAQAEVEGSMTIEEKPGTNYEEHAGDTPADVTLEPPEAPQSEPVSEQPPQDAAAGKYVLSEKEQADLGPEGVRELIASGEAVLAQDLAESA